MALGGPVTVMLAKIAFSTILAALLVSPTPAYARPDCGSKELRVRLARIMADVPDEEDDANYLRHPLLRTMIQSSVSYQAEIEAFLLSCPTALPHEVFLAIVSMQCLSAHEYGSFLARLADAGSGKVSSWAVYFAIVPGKFWSTRIVMGYRDTWVRAALGRLARSPNAQRIRDVVPEILDGSLARHWAENKQEASYYPGA